MKFLPLLWRNLLRRRVRTTTPPQRTLPSSRATLRNIRARQPLPIRANVVTRKP